jgi:NADH-quinone oxidoreductase E subunit
VARLNPDNEQRARDLIALYPHPRSALIPVLHLLQAQDGYLTPEGMQHVGELVGLEAAEVRGTASFYDMFHTEPVGRYLISVCTNIACMLQGAYELLEHAQTHLGIAPGGTTADGTFTLEDAECLALCGNAPCVTVNWRFFGDMDRARFDSLLSRLAAGDLDGEVPPHGTLCRVRRTVGVPAAGASVGSAGGPDPEWHRRDGTGTGVPAEAARPGAPADGVTDGVELETVASTPAVAALDGPDSGAIR